MNRGLGSLIFLTILCSYVHTMNDAEIKAEFIRIMMTCLNDHPVEPPELLKLQKLVPPKSMEAKCLLACAYKKEGSINAQGEYDLEHAYKVAEIAKDGDEKRLENGRKIADICSKVNEVQVSDGAKGCERAALIFKCVTENAPKFGFKV